MFARGVEPPSDAVLLRAFPGRHPRKLRAAGEKMRALPLTRRDEAILRLFKKKKRPSQQDLAKISPNVGELRRRAILLGVAVPNAEWTVAEDAILAEGWGVYAPRSLRAKLPGRKWEAIRSRAHERKLSAIEDGLITISQLAERNGQYSDYLRKYIIAAGIKPVHWRTPKVPYKRAAKTRKPRQPGASKPPVTSAFLVDAYDGACVVHLLEVFDKEFQPFPVAAERHGLSPCALKEWIKEARPKVSPLAAWLRIPRESHDVHVEEKYAARRASIVAIRHPTGVYYRATWVDKLIEASGWGPGKITLQAAALNLQASATVFRRVMRESGKVALRAHGRRIWVDPAVAKQVWEDHLRASGIRRDDGAATHPVAHHAARLGVPDTVLFLALRRRGLCQKIPGGHVAYAVTDAEADEALRVYKAVSGWTPDALPLHTVARALGVSESRMRRVTLDFGLRDPTNTGKTYLSEAAQRTLAERLKTETGWVPGAVTMTQAAAAVGAPVEAFRRHLYAIGRLKHAENGRPAHHFMEVAEARAIWEAKKAGLTKRTR